MCYSSPLRAIWGFAFTFSAISIPVTLRALFYLLFTFCFRKKVWTKYHNTTFGPKHLVHHTTQVNIPPEKKYFHVCNWSVKCRGLSVLYMIQNYCENVVLRYFCTVATNIEYDMKMIGRMLFLDNFAPLHVVLNILHDLKMIGRMLSWIFFAPLQVATNIVRRAQIEKAQSTLHQNPNQNFHHSLFIIIGLIITIISLRLKLKFHFSAETKFLWNKIQFGHPN